MFGAKTHENHLHVRRDFWTWRVEVRKLIPQAGDVFPRSWCYIAQEAELLYRDGLVTFKAPIRAAWTADPTSNGHAVPLQLELGFLQLTALVLIYPVNSVIFVLLTCHNMGTPIRHVRNRSLTLCRDKKKLCYICLVGPSNPHVFSGVYFTQNRGQYWHYRLCDEGHYCHFAKVLGHWFVETMQLLGRLTEKPQ